MMNAAFRVSWIWNYIVYPGKGHEVYERNALVIVGNVIQSWVVYIYSAINIDTY